jgi:hypothetical protein
MCEKKMSGEIFFRGSFTCLQQILEKGEIVSDIAKGFPVEKLMDTRNFLSLLFYLGLLTIKEMKDENFCLAPFFSPDCRAVMNCGD